VLSLMFMLSYGITKPSRKSTISVLLICSMIGVLSEYFQLWFTTTRQFSYYDMISNVLGSLLGVAVFWAYFFVSVKRIK
jgi:VanZ family protein